MQPHLQKKFVLENILGVINSIQDHKLRKTYLISIVEDVLTKRPYGKYITIMALSQPEMNSNLMTRGLDLAKCIRECVKVLTSEEMK
jgi:hypothetical protein